MHAALRGHHEAVQVLLGVEGIAVNARNEVERTHVYPSGTFNVLKLNRLLSVFTQDGRTALSLAASAGRDPVVDALLWDRRTNVAQEDSVSLVH